MISKKSTVVCLVLSVVLLLGSARYAKALPDLVVTNFTAPHSVALGDFFQISVTTRNQGDSDAGPFRVGLYLSNDATVTTGDAFFGICNRLEGLAVGEQFICFGSVTNPPFISAGTYYFGAIADDLGAVAESNETNNTRLADSGTITFTSPGAETVSTPSAPTGSNSGTTGTSYSYSTGGATSSLGHLVQYLFNWGDGTDSGWLPVGTTSASKSWSSANAYQVKAQARCATHNAILSSWSGILNVTISAPPETVSAPSTPTGSNSGTTGVSYDYSTGGATSNLGHSVQYLFNWGDGTDSGWLPVGTTSASKSWSSANAYQVKAQARCTTHNAILSSWSGILNVTISAPPETVSAPSTPTGSNSGTTGTSYNYSTGGAISTLGHAVMYRLDWGDGTDTGWLPLGTTTASKSWSSANTYQVKAQARCATHDSILSGWSGILNVTISGPATETISTPNVPVGPNSGTTGTSYTYATGGATSSLLHPVQYLFNWGDGSDSGWLPVGTTSAAKSWDNEATYQVKAEARCATDTSIVSSWSNIFSVTISDNINGPNLTGSWTTLTQSCRYPQGTPKCKVIGTLKIDNTGNQDSSPASLDYYLSTDGDFDPGDTPLKSLTIGKIKAGKSRTTKFIYSLPQGEMATGEYFVAVIDDYNLIIVSAQVP